MARFQKHHLIYKPKEWVLPANMLAHRTVSRIQCTRATAQAYADLTAFVHALLFEWNRMRMELDTGADCRVIDFTGARLEKKLRVKGKQAREITDGIEKLMKEFNQHDNPERLLADLRVKIAEAYSKPRKGDDKGTKGKKLSKSRKR